MGEIAEMMLDGTMCQDCGCFVDEPPDDVEPDYVLPDGPGYPRSCRDCKREMRQLQQARKRRKIAKLAKESARP